MDETRQATISAEEQAAATVVIPSALTGFAGGRSHIRIALEDAAASEEPGGIAGEQTAGEDRAGRPAADEDALDRPRMTLSAVLDRLRREVPALERRIRDERGAVRGHVNIYLDGVDIRELAGVGTVVVPGATVQIIAAVSGG